MLSPMMTADKKPSSRRTVFDASFGYYSLNKNTPANTYHDSEYEFSFPKIDDLADRISELGSGCFLWKRDLSRFFLQLKVDPFEYNNLGFIWRQKLYLFVSFVWGTRHAGYAGQWVTSSVSFIVQNLGTEITGSPFFCLNYSDDFAGAEKEYVTANLAFESLGNVLEEINLVESKAKACAPSTKMTYLGVAFDTERMCMLVDSEKLLEIKSVIKKWVNRTVAKKQELQSLLGKLLWVSKTVRLSRAFVGRIIAETRKLDKQSDKTVLSNDIRKDIPWWDKYLEVFSGVEIIPAPSVYLAVYGDACVQGGGGWNPSASEYFSVKFPGIYASPTIPIHIKEFFVVIFKIRKWGMLWSGHKIVIYCDNDAVCDTVTNMKPKHPDMQCLLRELLYWVCRFNFFPILHKISSKENDTADLLSRVHDKAIIDKHFKSKGYGAQSETLIPENWFEYQADW